MLRVSWPSCSRSRAVRMCRRQYKLRSSSLAISPRSQRLPTLLYSPIKLLISELGGLSGDYCHCTRGHSLGRGCCEVTTVSIQPRRFITLPNMSPARDPQTPKKRRSTIQRKSFNGYISRYPSPAVRPTANLQRIPATTAAAEPPTAKAFRESHPRHNKRESKGTPNIKKIIIEKSPPPTYNPSTETV